MENDNYKQLDAIANLPFEKKEPYVDMKFDSTKPIAGVLFEDFPNALEAVISIATFGAKKYQRNSWLTVSNAKQRYGDAMVRHQLAMGRGEVYDPESNLLHHAHFAWNALATLELLLRGHEGLPAPVEKPYNPFTQSAETLYNPITAPNAPPVFGERHVIIGEIH